MISMPRQVFLRNGQAAVINGLTLLGLMRDETMLEGHRIESVHTELWLPTGRWSYHAVDHPLDIVKLVTPKGAVVAFGQEVLQ